MPRLVGLVCEGERGGVCRLKIKVQLDSKTPEKVCVTNLGSRECSVQLNITITL